MTDPVVLVADVGKSRCRVELRLGSQLLGASEQHGFPGLGIDDGGTVACTLLVDTAAQLPVQIPPDLAGFGAAVVGVDGSHPNATELAKLLTIHYAVPSAVMSDATAAHLGALQGAPGTVLVVGTGAVAFRFDDAGFLHRADGWGPLLGDRGSGRWIGQHGLRAVMDAYDGGPETALSVAAGALVESPEQLPAWLSEAENPARAMSRFAPLVLQAAQAGDAVAQGIVDDACRILTDTVTRVTEGDDADKRVALLGGVVGSGFFAELLRKSLASAGIEVVTAQGDGMDGTVLAVTRRGLLQERYIHRDGTNWPE
jgi:N-acetylglucosamine kinase-like BadF-type ATPase